MSVLCPAAGIFFFPATFLITFLFDFATRADWKKEYGTIAGPRPSECLMSRWMQILLLVILQFVLQSLISTFLANSVYIPTSNTYANDVILAELCNIAAGIAFFVVNISWFLILVGEEFWDRRKMGKCQ